MFDAYQVAIELKLIDKFGSLFDTLIKKLVEGSQNAEKLQGALDNIGKSLKTGAILTGTGFGIASALKASTNEAVRYEQQMNKLNALNLGEATTKGLEQKALDISKAVKGTSNIDALKVVTETQSITNDEKQTSAIAPILAELKYGIGTYMAAGGKGDDHGAKAEEQFSDVLSVMQARGMLKDLNPDKLTAMADLFTKNYVGSGGNIKPSDFADMMKSGGVAANGVSNDFMLAMGAIIREKGGAGAGSGLMANYQSLVAGKMSPQIAEIFNQVDLLDHKAIHREKGKITSVDPNGLKDSKLFQERPDLFLEQKLLPALEKKFHIDKNDKNAVIAKLTSMSGQDAASDLFAQLYLRHDQIAAYVKQASNVKGVHQLSAQADQSVVGMEKDMSAKVGDLEKEFGKAALPVLKLALEQTIPLVKALGEWLQKHPKSLSMFVDALAGLSVIMMLTGPFKILKGVLGGIMTLAGGVPAKLGELGLKLIDSKNIVARTIGEFGFSLARLGLKIGPVIGKIASLGGTLTGLVSAGMVGWQIGSNIYEHMSDESKDTVGGTVATVLSWFGNKDAQDALDTNLSKKLSLNETSRMGFLQEQKMKEAKLLQVAPLMPAKPVKTRPPHHHRKKKVEQAEETDILDKNPFGLSKEELIDSFAKAAKIALVGTAVMLEAEPVGKIIAVEMARRAMAPSTGSAGFDSSHAPLRSN